MIKTYQCTIIRELETLLPPQKSISKAPVNFEDGYKGKGKEILPCPKKKSKVHSFDIPAKSSSHYIFQEFINETSGPEVAQHMSGTHSLGLDTPHCNGRRAFEYCRPVAPIEQGHESELKMEETTKKERRQSPVDMVNTPLSLKVSAWDETQSLDMHLVKYRGKWLVCGESISFELLVNKVVSDINVLEVWGVKLRICNGKSTVIVQKHEERCGDG
ncbi:hypothetical protein F5146DRAFT_1004681 [Armillaria mellea]|nr:hypothetical protein F5146DRAFT_1004681 [Armillaria mellea]